MKKLLISLIVITILSVTSKTYSDELIIPEVFLDYCTWYYTNIPDIHAASVIYGGAAKDFQTKAEFGWTLEKNINNIWTHITTYNFYEKAGPHINSWYGVDNLYYVGQAIAPHGNGNYRAKFFVKATSNQVVIDEYSVWKYATVNDIYAPATPSSYSGSWQSDHPFLNWSDNIEDDFKEYIVYKKVGSGSWNYLETTTSSQYTDYSESKYTAGSGEKRYVYYRISAKDYTNNESPVTSSVSFVCNPWLTKSNVKLEDPMITTFELYQNYPNPFNPTTEIIYQIPTSEYVSIKIYNSLGREVEILVNEFKGEGIYNIRFDASNLPNGIYYYTIISGNYKATKKMVLLK